jgi:DNA gyrase subunit A
MIINKSGIIIRLSVADLRVIGRATQGVRLINLKETDAIAAVTKVEVEEEVETENLENGENVNPEYGNDANNASDNTETNDGKEVDNNEAN